MERRKGAGAVASLLEALKRVADRRQSQGRRHPLHAILALITIGTLCGCQHQEGVAEWGRLLGRGMRRALGFTHKKTPAPSTLHLVLKELDVQALEEALRGWAASLTDRDREELRAIAIDGKTARGSAGKELPGVHVLSAFDVGAGIVLASVEVGAKTNEAKCAERFLSELDLEHAVVSGDAAFTQKKLCGEICDGKGEFVLAVKDNQPSLLEAIQTAFTPPDSPL